MTRYLTLKLCMYSSRYNCRVAEYCVQVVKFAVSLRSMQNQFIILHFTLRPLLTIYLIIVESMLTQKCLRCHIGLLHTAHSVLTSAGIIMTAFITACNWKHYFIQEANCCFLPCLEPRLRCVDKLNELLSCTAHKSDHLVNKPLKRCSMLTFITLFYCLSPACF